MPEENKIDVEKLVSNLKESIQEHQNISSKLNDKNQEIFDKETLYFGYLNNVNTSSTTSSFTNFLHHSSNSNNGHNGNNNNNNGPSYNSYGNIIKGFEGFVKNSIALGSGLNTGNALSTQLLSQVDKERDNKVINLISELSLKNTKNGTNKDNVKISAEEVIKTYLESYFKELPDLTSDEEKQILLNYYGKLKGNFGMDNGFDNGYINKNLYNILKQRQFFGNIGDDKDNYNNTNSNNGQSTVRSGRNNPASLGMPNKQDLENLVFNKKITSDNSNDTNVDGCELRDEDRIFSLSNAEYKKIDDIY